MSLILHNPYWAHFSIRWDFARYLIEIIYFLLNSVIVNQQKAQNN